MDKVTLTQEQLKELVKFIYSRGFREPAVVMAILDHFACKVEEKLTVEPGMPLSNAMTAAHKSFGLFGFKTLADAHQAQFATRYRKACKHQLRALATNPFFVAMLAVVGFLFFEAYYYFQAQGAALQHNYYLFNYLNPASMVTVVVFIYTQIKLASALPKKFLKHNVGEFRGIATHIIYAVFLQSMLIGRSETYPAVSAAITSVVLLLLMVQYRVEVKAINEVFADYKATEALLPKPE